CVGANAAIFSLIDPLLVQNPHAVVEPARVHRVYYAGVSGVPASIFSGASYAAIRDATRGVARVAPKLGADSATMGGPTGVRTVLREYATSEYLPLLVGAPALGRFFSAEEADAPAPLPRAVLSYSLWQAAFGADSSVIGRPVTIGTSSYTIVGVAPA